MKKIKVLTLLTAMLLSNMIVGQEYAIEWSDLQLSSARMVNILPKQGKDFFALRYSGGALLGSYKLSNHEDFKITATGKIDMRADGSMGSFEGARVIKNDLYVFLSDRKEGRNYFYMVKYGSDLSPSEKPKEIASYDMEKGKSKGSFMIVNSRNREFFGVVWEIPGKKDDKDRYGFRIFNDEMNEISDGDYKLPYEGRLSDIYSHYLSNTGDYFIVVKEYKPSEDKKRLRSYLDYKALHIMHVTPEGINDVNVDLNGKRVEALSINSDNNHIFTLTGMYGDKDFAGVSGLMNVKLDFNKQQVISEGFKEFGKDFITQDWSDREKERAEKRENRGKGEPKLYNYLMRQSEVLKDGTIVGSMEQYYVVVNTYTDPRTGNTRTTYTYYYNDIIAFKIGKEGEFDWLKKINKTQVSNNDGGPLSSYARFVDKGKLCFIFNDNVRNYDPMGNYLESDRYYSANYTKKKNVVAIVTLDLSDGSVERKTFFDRKEINAYAVPKLFNTDYTNKQLLLYAIYGKKERFGVLNFQD